MDALTLYTYAPGTGELLGSFAADRDPEGDGFLIPWGATDASPPVARRGQAAVFTAGSWSLTSDHRGETWYSADGAAVLIARLGDPATFDPPLSAGSPEPLPVPPPDISDRQFARGLWGDGIITYTDFLGFIGPGTIPAPIQVIVSQLPDDDTGAPTPRKDAVGFLTGSKLYSFSHPLVEFFRQALVAQDPKWTGDYLRQQWLLWATL